MERDEGRERMGAGHTEPWSPLTYDRNREPWRVLGRGGTKFVIVFGCYVE